MAGYAPTTFHLEEMVELWGDDFLRAIFVEAWERQDERIRIIQQREEEMRRRAEAAEAIVATHTPDERYRLADPPEWVAIESLAAELGSRQPLPIWQRVGVWLRRFGLEA